MIALAYLVLFGAPLLAALHVLKHRGSARAVANAIVAAWLVMPLLRVKFGGLPELDKTSLLANSVLAAVLIARQPAGRLRWFDVPMLVWCLSPFASSLANDLGAYDGFSAALRQTFTWGVPYVLGRIVMVDAGALTHLGRALLVGAAAYAPLCLIESRLAPQLHNWIYGMPGRAGWEQVGFYGPLRWKASVFLESPLELTPLLGLGFLFGWWLHRCGTIRLAAGQPVRHLLPIALIATLMGKSLGGISLTMMGAALLWSSRRLRSPIVVLAALAVAPAYVATRTAELWDGRGVVEFIATYISETRAGSLEFRMINEDMLMQKAMLRPVHGWGGWGRNRVYDEEDGQDLTVPDGQWILALGCNGMVGLTAWLIALTLPVLLVLARIGWRQLRRADHAALLVAVAGLAMHSVDGIVNAMPNPIYSLLAGGLGTAAWRGRSAQRPATPDQERRSPGNRATAGGRRLVPRSTAVAGSCWRC